MGSIVRCRCVTPILPAPSGNSHELERSLSTVVLVLVNRLEHVFALCLQA